MGVRHFPQRTDRLRARFEDNIGLLLREGLVGKLASKDFLSQSLLWFFEYKVDFILR